MMTIYRVDELAKTLQSTLAGSQESLDWQQAKRIRRTIIVDDQGEPEFLTWECRLPADDGNEQHFEMLRLPWTSLSQTESLGITELSIEFDCKVRKESRRRKKNQAALTASPIKSGKAAKKATHHIKLSASKHEPETSVNIDGMAIEDFLAEQLSPEQEQKELALKKRHYLTATIILTLACLVAAISYIVITT